MLEAHTASKRFVRLCATTVLLGVVGGGAGFVGPAFAQDPAPVAPAPVAPAPPPPVIGPPGFSAQSWVVADATTGQVLAARDAHAHLPQASTLKVLTSETLLPHLKLSTHYVGRKVDDQADGAEVGIVEGGQYTVRDLFHGLLLRSGNDAAMALANAYGGPQNTVAAMNAEAARLHANDTVAMSPSGLDTPGQHSSAFDLALIMRAALQNPTFRALLSVKKSAFPMGGASEQIETLDPLAQENYPGLIGGKTGYTSNAGRTYVGAAQQGNRTLIISMMNYTESTKRAATKLMNWGFTNAATLTPVEQFPAPDPVSANPIPASKPDAAVPAPQPRAHMDNSSSVSASLISDSTKRQTELITVGVLLAIGICVVIGITMLLVRSRRRTGNA